jgi:hypothetical protein
MPYPSHPPDFIIQIILVFKQVLPKWGSHVTIELYQFRKGFEHWSCDDEYNLKRRNLEIKVVSFNSKTVIPRFRAMELTAGHLWDPYANCIQGPINNWTGVFVQQLATLVSYSLNYVTSWFSTFVSLTGIQYVVWVQ